MNDRNYDFFNDYYKRSSEREKLELSLRFIVEKLNEKSMSAIVGAGFSRNSNDSFPDWANLLVDAYKEMHPKIDDNSVVDEIRRVGEPVVAAEYEKYRGKRESLDVYIEKRILQKQNMPQNLDVHESFLKLNWCDIITTNWDNLLEKADKKGKYKVVCSAKDLKLSNKDRIVKIHGSLRNDEEIGNQEYEFDDCFDHLYLITEKDYENYPFNHEGFSNFMKVKILENSFCLFGFSGNDWNFRYWVKELKRIMTKGGRTSNLNPIFMFDVGKEPYDEDQKIFFKNNYIIPLRLDDVFGFLDGPKTIEGLPGKFSFIFSWLLQKKSENDVLIRGRRKINDNKVLQSLAHPSKNTDLKELMLAYVNLPRFEITNLYYTKYIANTIQLLRNELKTWGETEYLFVYTWCLNNYFSLIQLFHADQIESIIKHYIDEKIYLTKANVFIELIFDYCFDCGKKEDMEKYISLTEKSCYDIVVSQKCKYFFKQLEHGELKNILNGWYPEKNIKVNPLHVLCKITSLLSLDEIYEVDNDIESLFEIALKSCGEEKQLLVFVLLFYNYCHRSRTFKIDPRLVELVSGLDLLNPVYPDRYIDCFLKKKDCDNDDEIKPNAKKRNQSSIKIPADNYNQLKYRCLLNFFEYINLPMEGIVSVSQYADLIRIVDEGCLYRLFPYSFFYFKHSSDGECIQTIVPLFLRRFAHETKILLFEKYLEIFEVEMTNDKNLRTLCFLMNEFAKRVEKKYAKRYYDLFYKRFSTDVNKILQNLAINGRIQGIADPFVDYLLQIDEEHQIEFMHDWIVERCLSAEKGDISLKFYEIYYQALIRNKYARSFLKSYYAEKSVISKILERNSFLIFYAFDFVDEKMKGLCTDFLKQNISLAMDPLFFKKCYSDEAKEKIVSIISNNDYRYMNQGEMNVVRYIYVLKELNKLDVDDLKQMIFSINKVAEIDLTSLFNRDCYRYLIKPYYELLCDIYESGNSELKLAIEESLNVFRPIYEKEANEILTFDWLSTEDKQKFRDSFVDSFSYSITMNRQEEQIPCIGFVLSKIFLDEEVGDVSKYESVLELFINYCGYSEWFDLFKKDPTIKFSIVRIMRMFRQEIPLCYDDLFVRDQMFKLANVAEKMGIEDESVMYWKNEKNADVIDSL